MDFVVDLIIVVLKILVFIGDFVIAFLKFLVRLMNLIAIFTYNKHRLISRKISKINFSSFFKLIPCSFEKGALFTKNVKKRDRRPKLKQKTIFRFQRFSFFAKIKYFLFGSFFSLVFLFIPLLILVFIQDLPSPKTLNLRASAQTTKLYDRNGKLLYQIYAAENRTLVPLSSIPDNFKKATIAIEDKDFYKHPGFDFFAIIRALNENRSGKTLSGASTITQQLIKSSLLTPEVSIKRKIKEIILAFWTEKIYTKDQILEMYFNQIPYGKTAWGAETAANIYFNKHVENLNLAQVAFLAGMAKAPTIYSPYGANPALWKVRQKEVLSRMEALGFISKNQKEETEKEELKFQNSGDPIYAPHFVMLVKDLLVKKYGLPIVEKGGLTVITSLDSNLEEKAQKIVTDEVNNNTFLGISNGASLVTNPANGDILAMVGSRDFSDPNGGNVNLTNSLRQPGSSIKVVTYSAALQNGFTAATILDDSPISYNFPGAPSYSPVNYDGRFHGKIPLRIALANSFNIPAVKVLNQIGVKTMIDLGKRMGISTWSEPSKYGLSITLGAAEVTMLNMTEVYGVLANGGQRISVNPILKVTDQKGEVLEEKSPDKKLVLDPSIAFIISDILADNSARSWEFGANSPLTIKDHRVSVKTGTSDNKRDNWTIGFNPNYVVAAWVGNNDNSPMSQNLASGITGAAPIFNKIMTMLLQNTKDKPLVAPFNVVQKNCLGRQEYFIKGTETSVSCNPLPTWTPTPSPH